MHTISKASVDRLYAHFDSCHKSSYFGIFARREPDNLDELVVFDKVEDKRPRDRSQTRWCDQVTILTGLFHNSSAEGSYRPNKLERYYLQGSRKDSSLTVMKNTTKKMNTLKTLNATASVCQNTIHI
ncbi:unnamed protein product [Pieris macdunnoughi]|uniref:Uncharacterized protein n=1 Tax=Pieris macdunnoughi TaxID=345717 RepID=A0A821SZ13_9NEOP|nr:unnamed protein product [Pieris macdunnoughi]